ncbi:TPA: helix-turn-helix transcriptional regulator [Streptococcus suis]|nr:helix-turn-helix transcriptional regulator [Streptococcus suis]HEM4025842.1 helix-turn-helix transcriptional regulator [Streptococcus suis]
MWEKLQKILVERGLTVVDLAKMADVPKTSIYNAKHHDIGFKKMEKIADALDVSLDEFRKEEGYG